jgi:hypothetical protein
MINESEHGDCLTAELEFHRALFILDRLFSTLSAQAILFRKTRTEKIGQKPGRERRTRLAPESDKVPLKS